MNKLLIALLLSFNIQAAKVTINYNGAHYETSYPEKIHEITDTKECEDIMLALLVNYLGIDEKTVKVSCNGCKIIVRENTALEDIKKMAKDLREFVKNNDLSYPTDSQHNE